MSDENDLLQDWFDRLISSRYEYREPLFGEITNSFVKKTCDALKQDAHVFVMSLEILEKYVYIKNQTDAKIDNELWTVCVCILIASKCVGDAVELKTKHLEVYLKKITGAKNDTHPSIKKIELDILSTIHSRIPLATKIDDTITVVEKFVRDFNLNASLLPVCTEILELLCVIWKDFFFDLKTLYNQNNEALTVFKLLITSKMYIPIGILIASLHLCNYRYVLNIDRILNHYSSITKIHKDHLNTLANKIILLVHALKPWAPKVDSNVYSENYTA